MNSILKYILLITVLIHAALGIWWLAITWLTVYGIFWLSTSTTKIAVQFRKLTYLVYTLILFGAVFLAIFLRVLVFGIFIIPSGSMEQTIIPGDVVWVNKLAYGPTLPNSPYEIPWINVIYWIAQGKQVNLDKIWWQHNRLKGFQKPKHNHITVFNQPNNNNVFIKRIIALPGDTLQIIDGVVHINAIASKEPAKAIYYARVELKNREDLNALPENIIVKLRQQYNVSSERIITNGHLTQSEITELNSSPFVIHAGIEPERPDTAWTVYPKNKNIHWDIDNYGPYTIPAKGLTIPLNQHTYDIYRNLIEKHEYIKINNVEDHYLINNKVVDHFTFSKDYYFVMGDHRHDSEDSRYFGPVPEENIIGKATRVIFPGKTTAKYYKRFFLNLNR